MKIATFTKSGNKASTEINLDKTVFERPVSPELLKLAYNRTLANARQDTAKTKTRGEISGGGKKPWRQKGTGRARSGSSRNPLWRTGGTIFGPTGLQNHAMALPKQAIRASIAQALSLKATDKLIYGIEKFDAVDGKVKTTADLLSKMKLSGKVLLVVSQLDELTRRSTANLANLMVVEPQRLTAFDILNADAIVIDNASIETLKTWLGGAK